MLKILLFFFLGASCCAPACASAAMIASPYINLFPDENSVSNHTEPLIDGIDHWSVLPSGNYRDVIAKTASNKTSSSMLDFSGDLGGDPRYAKDFSLSTLFTITDSVGDFNTMGFSFLSNRDDVTNNSYAHYVADAAIGNDSLSKPIPAILRFAELGPTNPTWMPTLSLNEALKKFTPYLLQLTGTYTAQSDLNFELLLSGNNTSYTFPLQDPIAKDSALQGNNFGYRNRAAGGSTVEYDSLAVIVLPQPLSIGFVAASLIGGYAVGIYFRRRLDSNVI